MNRPCHVLIVGAGIGGLCLAQGLKKNGIGFQVFERDLTPEQRLQGYRLNIEPMGARALHACLPDEIWSALVATAGDAGGAMGIFDEKLNCLMRENATLAPASPVDDTHAVSRRQLRKLLLAGLEPHVLFGKSFSRFEHSSDGRVHVHFADGSWAIGDLLVGADGINSGVRKQFLPHARVVPAGGLGIGGKLPLSPAVEAWLPPSLLHSKSMILPQEDFMFTAAFRRRDHAKIANDGCERDTDSVVDGDYLMWAYVARQCADLTEADRLDPEALRERTLFRMGSWSAQLRRIVAESDPQSIGLFDFRVSARVRSWRTTNITLLGDAIHAMPPVGGLGGNVALADAKALCDAVTGYATGQTALIPALRTYEAQMLKRGFATVMKTRGYLFLAIAPSRLLRAIARAFFKTCGRVPVLQRVVFGESS